MMNFAQYLCDLCTTPCPVSGLRQCVLCGRRACDIRGNEGYLQTDKKVKKQIPSDDNMPSHQYYRLMPRTAKTVNRTSSG